MVSPGEAGIPHVFLRNIKLKAKLLVAVPEEAENPNTIDIIEMVHNA